MKKLPQPAWAFLTLILLHTLQALTLLPWLFVAGLAIMAFDAPDAAQNWQPWAFVLVVWSYPIWIAIPGLFSWWLFHRQKPKLGVLLALLFSLPFPAFLCLVFAS